MRGGIWVHGIIALAFMAHAPLPAQTADGMEEIVVTARRTGIPVWRVSGPGGSIVLIGSIDRVVKGTKWDPYALEATLKKADRVIFASAAKVDASPLTIMKYLLSWKKQSHLPNGLTLAQLVSAEEFQRLKALRDRGILKADFASRHPHHLALDLQKRAKGQLQYEANASRYVSDMVKTLKIEAVPIASIDAKAARKDFFSTPPETYVRCLMDSVALVEAGPGAMKARSDAWAERRVTEVVDSPADRLSESCSAVALGVVTQGAELKSQIRGLLTEPRRTVAVVNLRALAKSQGVLDDLASAGFNIQGPRWR